MTSKINYDIFLPFLRYSENIQRNEKMTKNCAFFLPNMEIHLRNLYIRLCVLSLQKHIFNPLIVCLVICPGTFLLGENY